MLAQSLTPPYDDRALSALVNLRVHILRRSDGSGGLGTAAVDSLLARLAADFAPAGIHFAPPAVAAILHTTWFDDPLAHADTLLAVADDPGALDLILGPPTGAARGKAAGIPGTALVLAGDTAGTGALSHLAGHCFGLYETHETLFGAELPDGGNKNTAGDLVSDTAADPGLSRYVDASCELSAPFAIDHPAYDPDPGNIMSSGRLSCWQGFSAEQGARMLAVLEHLPAMQALRLTPVVTYTDRSALTGLDYDGQPLGAAAVDFNNDGKKDLLISRNAQEAMLWRCNTYDINTGTPGFDKELNPFSPSAPAAGTLGFILADYDNDGWTDFFAPNPNLQVGSRLYRNNQGTFEDASALFSVDFPPLTYGGIMASWADYDGDGNLDLLWGAGEHPNESLLVLFRNEVSEGNGFQNVTEAAGLWDSMGDMMPYLSALWGDLDGDGDLDLLLLDAADIIPGPPLGWYTRYLANNGDGTFTDVTMERIDNIYNMKFYTLSALVDWDNDGDLDVVYGNYERPAAVLLNDSGELTSGPAIGPPFETLDKDLTVLDFDLDGRLDVLVSRGQDNANDRLRLFANRQGNLIDETSLAGLAQTGRLHGLGLADYNLDGFADLYLTRTDAGHFFYKAAPAGAPQNQWTGVRLVSEDGANNYLALGATVTVTAGSHTQIQIVDGGSGKASQHEPSLIFGLGDWTGAITATVRWPTGRIQTATLQPNQYNTIVDDSPVVLDDTVTAYLIYHIYTGDQDWAFEWVTTHDVSASLDKVAILTATMPPQCIPAETELTPQTSGVDHSVTQLPNGTYKHQLIWRSVPCVAKCPTPFEVQSGIDTFTSKSTSAHQLSIPTCMQSL